jgi:hypothetical protein
MKSMSAIGPQQTSSAAPQMSALGGKANMPLCTANVLLDPKRTLLSQRTGTLSVSVKRR